MGDGCTKLDGSSRAVVSQAIDELREAIAHMKNSLVDYRELALECARAALARLETLLELAGGEE